MANSEIQQAGQWGKRVPAYGALALLLVVYVVHWYYLYCNAVDVPIEDEWEMLIPGGLVDGLSGRWLLSFHNEHRILPTRLLFWLGYKLDNLNLITQQMLSFALYGGVIWSLAQVKERILGDAGNFPLYPAFLLFLLSNIVWFNHVIGFQSQIHLVLLCMVIGSGFAFAPAYRAGNLAVFTLLCIAAIYTFALGMVITGILWLFLGLSLLERHRRQPLSRRQLAVTAGALLVTLLFTALWFIGYHSQAEVNPGTALGSFQFWDFFFNLVSFGFGIRMISWQIGALFLLITVAPVIWLAIRRLAEGASLPWQLIALVTAVIGSLGVISLSRHFFGVAYTKEASRYVEITFLLIPLTALSWWLVLERHQALRSLALAVFWLICCYGYHDYWNFPAKYGELRQFKLSGLDCLNSLCRGEGNDSCVDLYASPFAGRFDTARKLKLNFVKQLESCK